MAEPVLCPLFFCKNPSECQHFTVVLWGAAPVSLSVWCGVSSWLCFFAKTLANVSTLKYW